MYEPIGSTIDSDDDDVRVSCIHLGAVRCSYTTVRDEVWRRFSVFHTYIIYEEKNYELMIDGGSYANIITKTTLEKMGLKAEPHPH